MNRHRALVRAGFGLLPLLALSCSEAEVVVNLHSLQGSEDAVFLCRDGSGVGRPFADCPDRDGSDDESKDKALSIFALVSQTLTDEVAVVNVSSGDVVDVDPSTPGFGFLRVGGRPVSMATTPGGHASFVATAENGRNGLFGLPTSCIDAPEKGEGVRDLTSWPACRLDSAPGEITVLVQGAEQERCKEPVDLGERNAGAASCSADLTQELGPEGRRKLLVSLPDRGELVVIDAQDLLDRDPGEFDACDIEARLPLSVNVPPDAVQPLPPDLQPDPMCIENPVPTAPPPSREPPRPAGFALGDGRLFVADQAAPVVHVVDTSDLCQLTELEPLLPMSLREPHRVVTTRRVAVSPVTPSGKQFVYAIDAEDQPGASVMVFDVSDYPANRTPVVRPGSPELPGEKPDRLALASSAKDVTFAFRDLPYADPATGVGTFGTFCDPNPETPKDSPAALARPASDFTFGARPGLLRGLFGFVLLTNGSIAVVDVEDFDAPCRRPVSANQSSVPDFRGCAGDPEGVSFFTENNADDQTRTVTNEVSCRVVEPHRFRGRTLAINDPEIGVLAPALRGFPQLTLPADSASTAIEDRPRLLGVPFADESGAVRDVDVFVGSTPHTTSRNGDNLLPLDPNEASDEQLRTRNAVILPPLQPRSYAAEDTVTLTYEGSYAGERTAGFFDVREGLKLTDSTLSFCNAGVYDVPTMTLYAERELGLEGDTAGAFGSEHADVVQLTTALLAESEGYWRPGQYEECLALFKTHDAEQLDAARDFRIKKAFATGLELEPLSPSVTATRVAECFPSANTYRLRAGRHWVVVHAATGFNHDVIATGEEQECTRSCNPLKKWARARAFEISSRGEAAADDEDTGCRQAGEEGEPQTERVGCALPDEVACVYDQTLSNGVQPNGPGSECIFDGLNERFALYRGRAPSVRDSVFTWQTTGGFTPLVMSLANVSVTTAPQSLQFLQEPELMAVVDGAGLGLSLLSLDTFTVVKPSPFY